MTTQKPEQGQWWQYNGVRIYIAGVKLNGWLLCEYKDGSISQLRSGEWWQHLPDCTGWDWQPESFPQYWTAINDCLFAYCLRFSADKYRMVNHDGSVGPDSPWFPDSDRDRRQITKEEAEALVKPQESPYDWVEITDPNHVRRACDFVAGKTGHPDKWVKCTATIGFSQAAWPESKIRCRRKDLPVMPSPKRDVVLKQWIVWDEVGREWEEWVASKPVAWKNAFETGRVKTIEVQP